jgi:hypothetical protein
MWHAGGTYSAMKPLHGGQTFDEKLLKVMPEYTWKNLNSSYGLSSQTYL